MKNLVEEQSNGKYPNDQWKNENEAIVNQSIQMKEEEKKKKNEGREGRRGRHHPINQPLRKKRERAK